MICKNCGATIDDNTAVCEFCGAQYGDVENIEESEAVGVEAVGVEEAQETADAVTEEATENAVPENYEIDDIIDENEAMRLAQVDKIRTEKQVRLEEIERRRRDKKRRQRRNRILITILAVLCVGALGLGAYYISSSNDSDDDVVIITPRPVADATQIPVVTQEPTATPSVSEVTTEAPTEKPVATVRPAATKKPVATVRPAATKKPVATVKPAATKKPVVNTASDYNSVKAKYGGGQVFANSSSALLTEANLSGLSKTELRVARNEIYARHGRGFSNASLQAYFNGCSWYNMDANYDYANEYNNLNSTEKANLKLIKSFEAK